VGNALDDGDRPDLDPPRSFPGKLTRFLHERATAFGFDRARGMVVIPCELVEDNGARLKQIVLTLAYRWGLGHDFAEWVSGSVAFCNTLVDRIVPGAPPAAERESVERELGWRDGLMTACEPYRLFAIEGDDALRERLAFATEGSGVLVVPTVAPYRERKVRLLNGGHTAMVATALLAGCDTVLDAVRDERVGPFLRRVVLEEILPTVDAPDAEPFAQAVLDRFANPFIRHALFDITLQQTTKLRVRVVPTIVRFAETTGRVPRSLAFGFAAYLLFARGDLRERRRAAGLAVPPDERGERVRAAWTGVDAWNSDDVARLVRTVSADVDLWGADLSAIAGWTDAVAHPLALACRAGVPAALEAHLASLDGSGDRGAQPVRRSAGITSEAYHT
jgi:tagaturonate reductase